MRYRWEDLSDSELRMRVQQKLKDGCTYTGLWNLIRRRDEPDVAARIDQILGN